MRAATEHDQIVSRAARVSSWLLCPEGDIGELKKTIGNNQMSSANKPANSISRLILYTFKSVFGASFV